MTDINTIKNLRNNHDKSINDIAQTLRINWRTAKKYADQPVWPKPIKQIKRGMMYDEKWGDIVSLWLEEDFRLPKKKRRTALNYFEALCDLNFSGSYRTVTNYVREWKSNHHQELPTAGYERLEHPPGEAQLDFGTMEVEHQGVFKDVVGDSFNCLTVDGDTSPNDTVFLASTGKVKITWNDETLAGFYRGLLELSQELTRLMAKDGEGATKFVEVIVKCAQTHADALKIAKGVATSNLVKTALYGQDANWGRIISAIGQSQPEYLQVDKIAIAFESEAGYVQVCKQGVGLPFDETQALAVMSEQSVTIIIDLGLGVSNSKVWTCDMSLDYIKINADYRS